jgi:L-ascorbate metabolism protein UlaG (beta-lactamase superfamily)
MLQPLQSDDALVADIASIGANDADLHLWWLGQSGFLIKQGAAAFLFDPYLSDSLTKKYAATDKPHVRMTGRCIDPARLTGISHVTASHIHTDHLDAETLGPLAETNPGLRLFLPHPIIPEAESRLPNAPIDFIGLSDGDVFVDTDWEVLGVTAAHNDVKRDEEGRCHYIGFIIKRGDFTLYHSGDTLLHDGLLETLQPHRFDVMLLPINGNKPERRVSGNLSGPEAATLAHTCGARMVVPCHYDMFSFNTESPDAFTESCEQLGQPFRVLQCGERLTISPDRPLETHG